MTRLTPDLRAYLTTTYQLYRNNHDIHDFTAASASTHPNLRPEKRPSRVADGHSNSYLHASQP